MSLVRAKKHLGQHFLTDKRIAAKIVEGLVHTDQYTQVLEVGPGMGILSDLLLQRTDLETFMIDIDVESYHFLKDKYPEMGNRLILGDFLALDLNTIFPGKFSIIGNFPYNISSQILFKVLEHKDHVVEMVGMFQKEVAERCASKSGTKDYGILSVLIQAYYDIEYLFTVKPGTFNPPPKVNSGVIRLSRNSVEHLPCDEKLFWRTVKGGFNQRRKTLRNALSGTISKDKMDNHPFFEKRAEQLSVAQFIELTQHLTFLNNNQSS
ncbi:16S rRNA (adenine(1518)-N(6)/adenine(1519)-N(6))-dimethyltransferase RsmA [Pedobacter sp. MC2016-14]|uniref:16S rRNA (adenine(1518)-N(6)/adenine(1519)-N(6))- dimethyltransferase RsmA n=1 Tax=Pedobacter sp. MC2016-14 TaxID=2897327 RepID=UPI001E3F8039|nr:16S rRNA (adenine(1518)-N(6)/adenine(1519)-N(6))-dimethyltransferase RsmA [Pedobacter sp. MC2016-14]MCD0486749.1 16S rRNA (adenine(1518)-N(6)/adenine(1519)-N(6))-dimethyltransferase RsmA [Pedobacter sp. MC2016-14]